MNAASAALGEVDNRVGIGEWKANRRRITREYRSAVAEDAVGRCQQMRCLRLAEDSAKAGWGANSLYVDSADFAANTADPGAAFRAEIPGLRDRCEGGQGGRI